MSMVEKRQFASNPSLQGLADYSPNLPYMEYDGRSYTLDLLSPWKAQADPASLFPLIVYVQGCGWTTPQRLFQVPQLSLLAQKGYVVATVGHRSCLDGYQAPAFLEDVKTAIRFLRANAKKYHIDPERVGIWGTSSGGNAALLVGTTAGDPRFRTEAYSEQSDAVKLVVDCFGPTDPKAMLEEKNERLSDGEKAVFAKLIGSLMDRPARERLSLISPIQYVTPGKHLPPFLIIHGTSDTTVPYSQSLEMAERLTTCGYEVELCSIQDASHEGSVWSRELLEYVHQWIAERI